MAEYTNYFRMLENHLKITFENKSTILTDNKISKIDKSFLSRSVNVSTVMNCRSSSALLKKRNDFNPEYLKQITGVSSKVIKRPSNKCLKICTNLSLTKLDKNSNSDQNSNSLTPLKPNESMMLDVEKLKRKVINLQSIKLKQIDSNQFKTPSKILSNKLPDFNYTVPKNSKIKKGFNEFQEGNDFLKFSTKSINQLSDTSHKTVSFEKSQVEYIKKSVAHSYYLLGENMFKLLCPSEIISRSEFVEKCRDYLLFASQEALCLSVLCWSSIDIQTNESPNSSMITFESDIVDNKSLTFAIIQSKLMDFIHYESNLERSNCKLVCKKLCKDNDSKTINSFIKSLEDLCSKAIIEVVEFIECVTLTGLKASIKEILSILCDKSSSLKLIKNKFIKEEIIDCLSKELEDLLKNKDKESTVKETEVFSNFTHLPVNNKRSKCNIKTTETNETSKSERNKRRKDLIFRIADELYIRNITLMDVINSKIYDKVIDGREYQLIRIKDLISCLMKIGLEFDEKDKKYLNDFLVSMLNDSTDVKELITIMKGLGIVEDFPASTKTIDYFQLEGRTIRIFNRIIGYMKECDISDCIDIIPKEEIDLFTVVSKDKERMVETIRTFKFRDLLRSKDIINYGEELEEQFLELLVINENHKDIILLQKFMKITDIICKFKYFSYFGCEIRSIKAEVSNLAPVKRAVKRYSHIIYQNIPKDNTEILDPNKNINKEMEPETRKKIKHAIEMWRYRQLQNKRISETVNKAKLAFLTMIKNSKDDNKNESNLVRLNDSKDELASSRVLEELSEVSTLKESVTQNESFISIHNSAAENSQDRIRQLRKKFGLLPN